jgi:DNA-binding transcriptional LysR family regulator
MLDPRRVLTFREVAAERSFSRAAESLSLTQSAVSQQVASLERQAGTKLLERGRGGLRPTAAGERLLAHAEVIAERLRLADAQVAEIAADERGELNVGAFPSALAAIVPAALTGLLRRRPDLTVAVHEAPMADLAAGVREGSLHLAVCFQDAAAARREHEGLRRHDILDEPMVAALPPRHRLARRRVIDLPELAGETWTAPSHDGLVARTCRDAGFEPRIRFVAGDPLAIRGLLAAGLAVTVTSRLLAGQLSGVRIAPLKGAPARRVLYALLPDAGARPVDHEMVEELIAAAARAVASPLP